MDAILDIYTLEILGAAIRKSGDDEVRAPLPDELRALCERLYDSEGHDHSDGRPRDSALN